MTNHNRIQEIKKEMVPVQESLKLTPTEILIIRHMWDGLTGKEIAVKMESSLKTIEKHRSNISTKLFPYTGANAVLIVRKGIELGYIKLPNTTVLKCDRCEKLQENLKACLDSLQPVKVL